MKIVCMLYGRNEEKNLPVTLPNLINQGFDKIIYVDDCSSDNSVSIAEDYGVIIVKRRIPHESYVGKALLSNVVNEGIKEIYRLPWTKYFMISGCDISFSKYYLKRLIDRMENDKLLAIASGSIEGETTTFTAPRGAGRVYRFSFWDRYIREFPLSYTWESYPVYKALSLGYKTRSFPDIKMFTSRPTTLYKSGYGYAMRELGYSRVYALGRCFRALFHPHSRLIGVKMLKSYLFCDLPVIDKGVARWLKTYQTLTTIRSLRAKINKVRYFLTCS